MLMLQQDVKVTEGLLNKEKETVAELNQKLKDAHQLYFELIEDSTKQLLMREEKKQISDEIIPLEISQTKDEQLFSGNFLASLSK
jgi:hypothetical protein